MLQETIEREFSVVAPVRLRVKNIRGSVDVRPGDDGVATITAVKHLDTGDPGWTEIDISQEEDGSLVAKTIFEKGLWQLFNWREPCEVDYIVRVPRACSLKVGCVSSKTLVQGLEGEFYIKTVSGRVALSDLSGKIQVTSVSGKIMGERLTGPTDFESVSGKVYLIESNLPIVTGSSVSGDLLLQTPLGEGPYGFKTVSGDVKLLLPPETGCTIGFSSMSGRLKTSLPTTRNQRWQHKRYTELQGGGPPVRFSSVSGDFSVMEILTTNAAPA
jgi:hypothetical protein